MKSQNIYPVDEREVEGCWDCERKCRYVKTSRCGRHARKRRRALGRTRLRQELDSGEHDCCLYPLGHDGPHTYEISSK